MEASIKRLITISFFGILWFAQESMAQSIFTFQGLGRLEHQGMPNNEAMGELGIGTPTYWHVNTINPAHLVYNRFSTFQLGVDVESRNFEGDAVSGEDVDGGLRYLAYAFPIKTTKWGSSFGILPFSSVNYNTFSSGPIEGDTTVGQFIDESGEGGLTHLFWSNGVAITPNFSLGVRANFTFGSINKESQITIGGADVEINTISFTDQTSYSDFNFLFGAAYRIELNNDKAINLGATYAFSSNLDGTKTLTLQRLSAAGSPIESREVSTTNLDLDLPQTIGLGVSFQKLNNYTIGLDIENQAWQNSTSDNTTFTNQTKVVLGGEWTPDFGNVSSYFKRATYRLGFNYLQLPYIVNGEKINDFGINFGASLPVSGLSSMDLSFKYGQLGTTENGLIRETYYRIVVGATINDRWFIKRRYD